MENAIQQLIRTRRVLNTRKGISSATILTTEMVGRHDVFVKLQNSEAY